MELLTLKVSGGLNNEATDLFKAAKASDKSVEFFKNYLRMTKLEL
jgi:hypothetical protein